MSYLHSNLICHRDIKLENILVTEWNSSQPKVKLIDFGFAIRISPPTLTETRCGSDEYASPELVQSLPYDPRKSDIWAMGVVLFALLYKVMPFHMPSGSAKGLRAMYLKIAQAKYKIPELAKPRSQNSVDLIRCILVASPARRASMEFILNHPFLKQ